MKKDNTEPLVSIYMTTYYHEEYVRQAIDSILAQKVDFPLEIVISDDASGDGTAAILEEYAKKYSFIKVNINKKNLGLTANMFLAKSMCTGQYLTELSGDDYWIDENKLTKQVAFLESHPEYYGVGCRMEMRPDNEKTVTRLLPDLELCERPFTLDMFMEGNNLPLNGFMMRNPFLNPRDKEYYELMPKLSPYIDDLTDCILILRKGNVYILPDAMVAYRVRVQTKNDRNFNSLNKGLISTGKHIALLNRIEDHFGAELDLYERYKMCLLPALPIAVRICKPIRFMKIYNSIPSRYRQRGLLKQVVKNKTKHLWNKLFQKRK